MRIFRGFLCVAVIELFFAGLFGQESVTVDKNEYLIATADEVSQEVRNHRGAYEGKKVAITGCRIFNIKGGEAKLYDKTDSLCLNFWGIFDQDVVDYFNELKSSGKLSMYDTFTLYAIGETPYVGVRFRIKKIERTEK